MPICGLVWSNRACAGAGLRIFRLLKAKRQLEQKQVAEQAVLPPKEANVTLYTLLRGGFVCIQVLAPAILWRLVLRARRVAFCMGRHWL